MPRSGAIRCISRLRGVIAAASVAVAVLALLLPANVSAEPRTYTIQDGETLFEIALRMGIRTSVLAAINGIEHENLIYAGQELLLPDNADIPPPPSPTESPAAAPEQQPRDTEGSQAVNAAASPPVVRDDGFQIIEYVVRDGDNATLIAEAHGLSIIELQQANPTTPLRIIHVGQALNIPVPNYHRPALDPESTNLNLTGSYTVQPGDYAGTIAERYGIDLNQLRTLNGGDSLDTIYVGQHLIVPWTGAANVPPGDAPAVPVRYRSHTVADGDTFHSIAVSYGLSLDELRGLNPERDTDLILIGETLRLPGEVPVPVVAETRYVQSTDLVQYVAAEMGVTPHTLLANNPGLGPDDWVGEGVALRIPHREGLLVTVQASDTLRGIAERHGVDLADILSDPAHGVDDPNTIVIGQEIILPLAVPDFIWPALGPITDPFGLCRNWDCSYRHRGLDLALDNWHPITASADGLVVFVGGDPCCGLGIHVEVEHANGWRTIYAHLIDYSVDQGQLVRQGELVGYNGSTGYSTGPHLHLEVHHNDWYVDPKAVLPPLPSSVTDLPHDGHR